MIILGFLGFILYVYYTTKIVDYFGRKTNWSNNGLLLSLTFGLLPPIILLQILIRDGLLK